MATGYPFVFSELKAKVGVDDIAYSLGYTVNRKAGIGRYMELIYGDPRNPSDTIVVNNTPDKSRQFFFRRDGSKGDVITFIRQNLNSFNVDGKNEWTKVANVLANFANVSQPLDYRRNTESFVNSIREFNPARYVTIDIKYLPGILKDRGISMQTVAAMGDKVVLIKDKENEKYQGFNVAFRYTRPHNDSLAGYEIRGSNGFKSKAAGTDSANSAWIVDFPREEPHLSRNVFFFESSLDAMAFYQMNRVKLQNAPFSLVSVGGSFNPGLVDQIMKRYPAAKAWDCFDNDPAGQIYSATLVKTVDRIDFDINTVDGIISLNFDGRQLHCPKEQFVFKKSAEEMGIRYSVGHWKSPSNFKDWNDCLMGKAITPELTPSKYERDENLLRQRQNQSSLKF